MKKFSQFLFVLVLCCLVTYNISAQGMTDKMDSKSSSLTKLVADDIMMTGKKVMSLAEAMPAKDYNWRPMDGVRSVSEVYVHVAATNYMLLAAIGMKMPDNLKPNSENEDLEKTMTDKKEVTNFLKQSFEDAQKFLAGYTDTDYDTPVKLPFGEFTKGQILMIAAGHVHEHLGQSIAYARTNHIVPPWSMPSKK
ncbi:MAG: DinB family protein [Ignavibacteriaceae bacterium]